MDAATRRQIGQLVKANRDLEAAIRKAETDLIKGFRRAESAALKRMTELLVTAPNFSKVDLNNRLGWYLQNLPSQELAAARASYMTAVESYVDKYDEIGRLAGKVLGAGGISREFTEIPGELIKALRDRDIIQFADLNHAAHLELDRALLNSAVVGRTPAGTLEQIRQSITGSYPWGKKRGLYEWHAGTYARTAAMRSSRQMLKAKADELKLRWFVYIGPVDSKKRPFCLELVGGVYNRQQIEDLDNGQTGDTFSDGGGYNCRDTWSPVDEAFAKELNAEAGEAKDTVKAEMEKQGAPRPPEPAPKLETGRLMENDAWVQSLTDDEAAALHSWKGAGYVQIRQAQYLKPADLELLDQESLKRTLERIRVMHQALDRAKPYKGGPVWRGMADLPDEVYHKFTTSKEINMNALSSASKDVERARAFAGYGDNRILLKVADNKSGVDIQKINGFNVEQEVILRKGARYRVVEVVETKGVEGGVHPFRLAEITLEEI
jgi:hypothetical protein